MPQSRKHRAARALLIAVGLTLAIPMLGFAQGGPGFLFKQPRVTFKVETGYGIQTAGSEIFDFVVDSFSVQRSDFSGPYFGGEVAIRATDRLDIALGAGMVQSEIDSELLFWEDLDGNPIEQLVSLRVIPITVSAKYYLSERGRSVGRFVWIPNRLTPYVGGGVGFTSYRFSIIGDFVDAQTLDIFYDRLESIGEAFLGRALAGAALSLGGQFELTGELRYHLSSADMDRAFEGFDPLDLNGFQGTLGIGVRF